ncbi:hypothetical protein [Anoxynatronum buryatiense]|uniref:hypothetical protein n=1 Tax=Anoxynatronum buryatiense TaxID=489973 RepID=UPI0024B6A389|nr:hypothetical protein [Anoxynatronum buryatiense]
MIIQKEFSGFDDTKERCDLLVFDEQGSLMIIENKLDDSGSDSTREKAVVSLIFSETSMLLTKMTGRE